MNTPIRPKLMVWCLGEPGISLDNGPHLPLRPKVNELLTLLLMAHGEALSRREIVIQLWGSDTEANKANLRAHLKLLRQAIRPQEDRLETEDHQVWLRREGIEVDAFTFAAAMRRAQETQEVSDYEYALSIYSGSLLPFSNVSAIEAERKRLHALYLNGIELLAEKLIFLQQPEQAIAHLWRSLKTDPLRESTIGLMLQLLERDAREAGRVFKTYEKALQDQFLLPNAKLLEQYNQIHLNSHSLNSKNRRLSDQNRPNNEALSAPSRRYRVPALTNTLIGRSVEMQRVTHRLAQSRLVMLTGTGGVGKTRLALEIAHYPGVSYRDGVVFVDLAGIPLEAAAGGAPDASQERIAELIAGALDLEGGSDRFRDTVVAFLATRHMLLVLDNCEHLPISCSGLIRTLVHACPGLTLLVTSRVELTANLGVVVEIKPLHTPTQGRPTNVAELRQSPAIQLFESIALQRRPDFQLTQQNAAAVEHICRATDGLPLAIQLVASASFLTLTELSEQLVGGFAAVAFPEDSTLPVRSRNVFKSLAWSYHLLSQAEKRLFSGVSIFANGWTREATDAIFPRSGPEVPPASTLLDLLCVKSLVERREQEGRSRYFMLETIREFARQFFQESHEVADLAQRHLEYYLKQAETMAGLQEGGALKAALQSLAADQENLRAALDYGMATGQTDKALRLASALTRYWYVKGRHQEGHVWLERVLKISGEAPADLRRDLLNSAGTISYARRDYERAETFWRECLQLSRDLGDIQGALQAQGNLGNVAVAMGEFSTARTLFEVCLKGYRDLGSNRGEALALANLAMVARGEQNYSLARRFHEESIQRFKMEPVSHAMILGLNNLADTLIFLKEYQEAHTILAEVIELSCNQDNPRNLAHCLTNYVMLAIGEADMERAALLMGAEEALRKKIETPLPMQAQVEHERALLKIAAALGTEAFTALRNAGAQTSIPELCVYAKKKTQQPVG